MFRSLLLLSFCLLLAISCSVKSPSYFQKKGRAVTSQLTLLLEEVNDLDDLIERLARLQTLFDELVEVMIEARKWQIKEGSVWDLSDEDLCLSSALCAECNRIFTIPAARDLIEKSQHKALERLTAFEDKLKK